MSSYPTLLPLVGLGIAAGCSAISVNITGRCVHHGQDKAHRYRYQDKDGQSTIQDTLAFSSTKVKTFGLIFCLSGLVTSIGFSLYTTKDLGRNDMLSNWLSTAPWAFFLLQSICIISCHDPVASYNMGAYLALSSLIYGLTLLAHITTGFEKSQSEFPPVGVILEILRGLATAAVLVSNIMIPRRPAVYFDGHRVDDMYSATLLSRLTWNWAWGVPMYAQKLSKIEFSDMPLLPHWTRAKNTAALWNHLTIKAPLAWALARMYWKELSVQWALGSLQGSASFAIYWTTLKLLETLESLPLGSRIPQRAWLLVAWMSLTIVGSEWLEQYIHWLGWGEFNNCVRAQMPTILYEKLMRRKNVGSGPTNAKGDGTDTDTDPSGAQTGSRVTSDTGSDVSKSRKAIEHLFGSDALSIADFAGRQELLALTVVKLIASLVFLVRLMGWVPLGAGFFSWAVILPCGMWATKRYTAAQRTWVKIRDRKQAILSESINGIRQVKFSAREEEWEQRIMAVRENELDALWKLSLANCINVAFWMVGPIALAVVSLAVYATIHGHLAPSLAFVSLTAFRRLEGSITVIPDLIMDFVNFSISIVRIQSYLDSPDLGQVTEDDGCSRLAFIDATLAWPADDTQALANNRRGFLLKDLNIEFPPNKLSIICGRTGSGKSLLLEGLLGEVDLLAGHIKVPEAPPARERRDDIANPDKWVIPGAKAFVGQTPWIENATLRDNILFGLPMQPERYAHTLGACALTRDLDILPDGDESELGVNGVNLSGGQKWRVSLARAIYSRAGILIMDDIFSAVDAHVGRHLFERCISSDLCAGRTMIIATHHIGLCLPMAHLIVELADGKAKVATVPSIASRESSQCIQASEENGGAYRNLLGDPTAQDQQLNEHNSPDITTANGNENHSKARRKFIHAEARPEGAVRQEVYRSYLTAVGERWYIWWGFVVVSCVAFQIIIMGRSWWLKIWSSHDQFTGTQLSTRSMVLQGFYGVYGSAPDAYGETHMRNHTGVVTVTDPNHEDGTPDPNLHFYLAMYLAISACGIIASSIRLLYLLFVGLRSGRTLFKQLTGAVLRAPLLWIDTTPAARILNRLVVDSTAVDRNLMGEFGKLTSHVLNLVGICVAAWFVSPYFIILASLCMMAGTLIARHHVIAKRPVKRLESVARSPIFGLFSSSLTGITTIRAYDRTAEYITAAHQAIDVYISCSWYIHINNHWLGFGMGMIGAVFTTSVAVFVLANHVDAALAGFSLSFAVEFSTAAMWAIRTFVALENNMNAMERVVEYSSIGTEPRTGDDPPAAWPTDGRITVDDLVVAYAPDLPPVLRGVSFSIRGGERVGVIGRTGAGKSSLTLAMFRFLEAISGTIHIDGLDISRLTLHHLRSRLTIIPQDPLLFSGTIRSNLDPFGKHDDDTLYDALRRVRLFPNRLDELAVASEVPLESSPPTNDDGDASQHLLSAVTEGGANLSHGQRQLLCLARAIVERPRIMLLDEATSAVDMATDHLIQRSIRDEFSTCTLIVIAHRLSTVADFDRVLVLDEGRVAEFGSPQELWHKHDGIFRSLCDQSGEKDDLERMISAY